MVIIPLILILFFDASDIFVFGLILDEVQANYKLEHSEIEVIWHILHDCLLLKRRNAKKNIKGVSF